MDKNKFVSFYVDSILILVALFLSIFIAAFIFCLSFYIHEFGHIFFGFIDNLFHLKLISPYISNYVDCLFLSVPQQTRNISDSTLFASGGSLFTLLLFIFVAYYSHKKLKNNAIWIYLILIAYSSREIIFNIIFGTDNFKGLPLMNLKDFPFLNKSFDYFLLINVGLTALFFYSVFRDRFKQKIVFIFQNSIRDKNN